MRTLGQQAKAVGPSFWLILILLSAPVALWVFTLSRTETWTGRLVVVFVGAFTTLVSGLLAKRPIKNIFAGRGWTSGAWAVNLSQAMLSGLLAGWAAFAVIPEGATARIEASLDRLVDGQRQIIDRLPPPPPQTPPIVERLPGLWGEPGCEVVWRFNLTNNALTTEVVTTLPGLPPYRLLASITSAAGYRLETIGEEPEAARGMAATFILDDNSAISRLSWVDRTRQVPLVLEPCPEDLP